MIKKTARRILNRIAKHLTYDEVSIEHPELISPTAKVRRSQLFGDINVGDFSKLIGARINGKVRIGRWTVLAGPDIDIFSEINSIEIGNFCSIARYVAIQEYNHNAKKITTYFMMRNFFNEGLDFDVTSKGSIFIGNDVWIGAQCIILSGAHISDGCVIGANSVVAGYIPPYSIAVGSPAKVLKSRFDDDMVRKLLAIKWWNWTDDKIKRNKKIFISELTTEIIDQISD